MNIRENRCRFRKRRINSAPGKPIKMRFNIEFAKRTTAKENQSDPFIGNCRSLESLIQNSRFRRLAVSKLKNHGLERYSRTSFTVFLLHVQATTDRTGRIVNKHRIRTIYKPTTQIGQFPKKPKRTRGSCQTHRESKEHTHEGTSECS